MPITKTAKRAERSSKRKAEVNKRILSQLEIAIRLAKKSTSEKNILKAISLADRAAKKRVIHKNKSARIKGSLTKLVAHKTRKANASNKGKVKKGTRKSASLKK
ncbi:hypothetical protein A3A76_04945 [Candidatus Woesebacteria bacterium RIFCSPLOWO2_01_FULL_39_23]|uniref:30S ribosomal protein S20 n=2 Tax=Microgenomates group TaxID=1794810 RepID=A0A0H4TNN4_9BACT|nr:hypothetical protein [uncultured Microgenomates bacterium Rifle_16ft_4_minimus_37633]OGM13830.1 MAG: hypothetical protein A2141_04170 [Candidatus Woesebacteria bacterium RBG_16_40_11]OGM27780.1 MAG: hypothetical protein A2628_05165 [Candidatus Woesebacteria bacterium RIFCSPHIGHO2_01_FULL_40_22]OGM36206.1 MAG: hypothetical protein A3E41_00845 [Candidatus Woesebacteria bacterium RIFCSPHIGHO2_12_FULL_38_9]OGM62202.1 MAG: hypothetical protein A3A76_04945 [Candidatus Woesebacteria bacterium RIFCS